MSSDDAPTGETATDRGLDPQTAKLVRMANQIATFFASQPSPDRAGEVADHLASFWDPRMRRALLSHLQAGGAGLSPLAADAAERLRARQTA